MTEIKTFDPEIVKLMDDLGINTVDFEGSDKATRHNYTGVYAELLAPYRDKQCRLLEIGTRAGGSAVLWRNYLPKARLDLVDLKDNIVPENLERLDNFELHLLNAYSGEAIEYFIDTEEFDIIIDDGSHESDDLIFAASNYYPLLAPGGVLILEDIPDERLLAELADLFTPEMQQKIRVFDMRESGRYDDLIWTISK